MNEIQALAAGYRLAHLMRNVGGYPPNAADPHDSEMSGQILDCYSRYHRFMQSSIVTTRDPLLSHDSARMAWSHWGLPSPDRPDAREHAPGVKFSDLVADRKSQVESGVVKLGSFNNERTSLRKFVAFLGVALESAAAPHFNERFEGNLERFLRTVPTHSQAAYRTRLETWQRLYKQTAAKLDGNRPLHEILKEHFGEPNSENYETRVRDAATSSGISFSQLERWVSGRTAPSGRLSTRKKFTALERHLKLQPSYLASRIGRYPVELKRIPAHQGEEVISQQDINRVLPNVRIRPEKWPAEVEEFIEKLVRFKRGLELTLDASGEGIADKPVRNRGWKESTAQFNTSKLYAMVSWLCLPADRLGAESEIQKVKLKALPSPKLFERLVPMFQGKGMSPQEIKVGHLFDPVLVDGYLKWRRLRALDKVNEGQVKYLKIIKALLAPEFGFVTQQPELAWSMPGLRLPGLDPMDVEFAEKYQAQKKLWATFCARRHALFGAMLVGVEKNMEQGGERGPDLALKAINNLEDPLSVLLTLIKRHGSRRPSGLPARKPQTSAEAQWLQNQLLLRFVLSNPLRNKNIREMTWRSDNSGSLYRKGEEWWVRFSRGEMKSVGATKGAYDVQVISDLAPYLDSWLLPDAGSNGREVLRRAGKSRTDCVFLTSQGNPFTKQSLSTRFATLTAGFLSDLDGVRPFRSHAWRHIVATGYLKVTGDFLTLSFILHDRLETVMRHYAHLVPQDGFNTYSRWLQTRTADL